LVGSPTPDKVSLLTERGLIRPAGAINISLRWSEDAFSKLRLKLESTQYQPAMSERQLTRAIVRTPGASLVVGLTSAQLGAPDYAHALEQHAIYCNALESCGLTLTHLPASEQYPDSTFVEDTCLIIPPRMAAGPHRVVITRPGADSRRGETAKIDQLLASLFGETLKIVAPGTVDGGDVCEAGDQFFIGISQRTNAHGGAQLAEFLQSFGYHSSFVDIRDLANILHLKSGIAYLGNNRLAVTESFAGLQQFSDYELVRLAPGEEYAANCVVINDSILIAAGFRAFEHTLKSLGYRTLPLDMSEFQKLDGGLSCLSLRW
jgi:dimethylargininase